jgi:hypothetical protein
MRRSLAASVFALALALPGTAGSAAQARLALDVAAPIRSPWTATSSNRSLYPTVGGYDGRRGLGLTVTGNSGGPNASSEMTAISLSNHAALARAKNGQEAWYRVRVRFPDRGLYNPTAGQWNWVIAWHEEYAQSTTAYSIAMGVYTDYPSGRNARLVLRLMGGQTLAPSVYTCSLPSNSLELGHWYDLQFHFVWSPDPAVGNAEWWVDGEQVCSLHFPTLYRNPDGSITFNNFGLYNYRRHADWTSRIDFDDIVIGPTRASLAPNATLITPRPKPKPSITQTGWTLVHHHHAHTRWIRVRNP